MATLNNLRINLPQLKCVLLNINAKVPQKQFVTDGGFDLSSCENITIKANTQTIIKTGLQLEIPYGFCGKIESRSGLTVKHCLDVRAGVIDYGYTGEIGVVVKNDGDTDYTVNIGDRIAQLIIYVIPLTSFMVVDSLNESERKDGGFGSTGNN